MANEPLPSQKSLPGFFNGDLYQETPFPIRPLGPYNFSFPSSVNTDRPHYLHTHTVNFSNMLNIHRCLYRLVNCYWTGPETTRFILRPPRNAKETPCTRDQRYLNTINRFIDLSVRDLIHAETQLPKPRDSPRTAMGIGRDVLPAAPWADYKTNLSLALEVAYFCIVKEMSMYMDKVKAVPLPPMSQGHILYKWQWLRFLAEKAADLAFLVRRAQRMELLRRPIVFQAGYGEWWNKLTARATWMEMVQSAQKVPEPGFRPSLAQKKNKKKAISSHNPELQSLKEQLNRKRLHVQEQAEHAKLGLKHVGIQWWILSHSKCAIPPAPQLGIPRDDDEEPVPVRMNGPQISFCLEEGRAHTPLLGEMVMLGLEMIDTSAVESGEQPWWDHILHMPSQDEALDEVVERVVEDIMFDLKLPYVPPVPKVEAADS